MSETSLPRIRRARPGDAAQLATLCNQLGYPSSPEEVRRRLQRLRGPDHAVYVAEDKDGTVVGWVHIFLRPLLEEDLAAEIGGLVVDEAHRGRGIGHRLLERAERWARRRGSRAVVVRSNVIRLEAHRFYEQCGYREVKTQRVFRKAIRTVKATYITVE